MGNAVACPLCGVNKLPPLYVTRGGISWSDDCACNDHGYCYYHRNAHDSGPPPRRPTDEEFAPRIAAEQARQTVMWEERNRKIAEYNGLKAEVASLKAQLAELEAIEEVSLNACRELAKLQCVCAGYEGPDCVSCKARKALENK